MRRALGLWIPGSRILRQVLRSAPWNDGGELVVPPPALRRRLAAGEFFQARIVSRRHAPHVTAQVFAPFSGAAGM